MKRNPLPSLTQQVILPLYRPILALLAILLWLSAVLLPTADAQEQVELPSYWQYTSSGRLHLARPADVNGDGVDEFIVVDDNNRIDVIDASGEPLWSRIMPNRATALAVVNLAENGELEPGIVIGVPNQLIMLSAEGDEIWRTAINPLDIQSSLSGVDETSGGEGQVRPPVAVPGKLADLVDSESGRSQIVVLLESGELILLDTSGNQIWRHTEHASTELTASPQMLVTDLDLDGQDEIIFSVINPRRFGQLVLIDDGRVLWDLSLSRIITDLEAIRFREDSQPLIAVSTTSGHVQLIDYLRRRHWLRTLNTPATSLAEIHLPDQSLLAVGTDTGVVTAFDEQGRSVWSAHLADGADREVLFLASTSEVTNEHEPVLAAVLESNDDRSSADIILLDGRGKIKAKIT
ncbi:MAG: PQQ-binding-like beta-propeller repeat protein, partial [Candidatus Promineifilaceae bacterium]